MTTNTTRADVYTTITNRIVEQLENGVRPWMKPWNAAHKAGPVSRPLRNCGKPYSGINILVLWLESLQRGFDCPLWLSYNQAREAGGHVRKGEKSTTIVYANTFEKTQIDEATGEESRETIGFYRSYQVFNAQQCDNLPQHYYALAETPKNQVERLQVAEEFFANTKIRTEHGGTRAYYSRSEDSIQLPPYETFHNRESYYSTRCHESIHASGHASRLNREFGKRFGDASYSVEELVAEMGAAFLCADLGITPEVMPEHAQYLKHWLDILRSDARAIFTAASHASRAVEFLHSLQPQPVANESHD